jgi:beta-lactam-binding protein with PASTA domain
VWDTPPPMRGAWASLSPTKGAIIGALAALILVVGISVWAHFVFDLKVTAEQDRVKIPDLVGQRFDAARGRLKALGVENVRTPGSSYLYGVASKVEDVIPAPGTEIEKDSTVTLIPKL